MDRDGLRRQLSRREQGIVKHGTRMKAYVASTGALFGLVALAHLLRTVGEWSRLSQDPWFILEGPGLGVFAGAFAVWAWRLLRQARRRAATE
jgi:protein-S-isoprenylcysteine O-methyltransferase Ste14